MRMARFLLQKVRESEGSVVGLHRTLAALMRADSAMNQEAHAELVTKQLRQTRAQARTRATSKAVAQHESANRITPWMTRKIIYLFIEKAQREANKKIS